MKAVPKFGTAPFPIPNEFGNDYGFAAGPGGAGGGVGAPILSAGAAILSPGAAILSPVVAGVAMASGDGDAVVASELQPAARPSNRQAIPAAKAISRRRSILRISPLKDTEVRVVTEVAPIITDIDAKRKPEGGNRPFYRKNPYINKENKPLKEQLDAWVDAHRDEIIAETQGILRIPSVLDPATAGVNAPFGKAVGDALEHTLAVCAARGMATENFGGYAGHADFGGGPEIVGILGHLDVVPVGRDWTVDPWGAILKDGFVWARGSSDDKGPTYAALFGAVAVKALTEAQGIALSRKVRLIFGCDEESEWRCTTHYFGVAGQPQPTVAFTPDADFPLVYAEKGSFTGVAERAIADAENAPLAISAFHSGLRANMVPDEAVATLTGTPEARKQAVAQLGLHDVTVTENGDNLSVSALGVSAHGSTPEHGVNAAVKLMNSFASLRDLLAPSEIAWMTDLARRGVTDGSEIGIGGRDEITGPLTSNLGVLVKENGGVRATFNIRYPATWNGDETTGRFRASLASTGWAVPDLKHTPPLYVPQDKEPVKTLLRVYREHTGDMRPPNTMGGRTYATVVAPNGVAFGPAMPGDPEVAHQADERFSLERLIQCAKIYAHAIYELAK